MVGRATLREIASRSLTRGLGARREKYESPRRREVREKRIDTGREVRREVQRDVKKRRRSRVYACRMCAYFASSKLCFSRRDTPESERDKHTVHCTTDAMLQDVLLFAYDTLIRTRRVLSISLSVLSAYTTDSASCRRVYVRTFNISSR